jgi:ankyrin repeat protein
LHNNNVEILLNHGAYASCQNKKGDSPLHLAAGQGHLNCLETLLAHDPNLLEFVNPYNGYYPIHSAVSSLQLECASMLLKYEVNRPLGKQYDNLVAGQTAYFRATKQHALDRLRPIHPVDSEGAKLVKVHAMLDLLLAHMPPFYPELHNIVDGELGSVLHYFAALDYSAGINQLAIAPHYYPLNIKNLHGETPLLLAIKSNSFATAHQLLALNVDIDKDVLQLVSKKWLRKNDEVTQGEITRIIAKLLDKGNVMPDKIFFFLLTNVS